MAAQMIMPWAPPALVVGGLVAGVVAGRRSGWHIGLAAAGFGVAGGMSAAGVGPYGALLIAASLPKRTFDTLWRWVLHLIFQVGVFSVVFYLIFVLALLALAAYFIEGTLRELASGARRVAKVASGSAATLEQKEAERLRVLEARQRSLEVEAGRAAAEERHRKKEAAFREEDDYARASGKTVVFRGKGQKVGGSGSK